MDFKTYQRMQLRIEQARKTRRTLALSLLLILTLPGSIGSATITWVLHNHTVIAAKSNEDSVVTSLGSIIQAQSFWIYSHENFGTFAELHADGLVKDDLKEDPSIVAGYLIKMNVVSGSTSSPPSYTVTAAPLNSGGFFSATGYRHFFVSSRDQSIHVNDSRPATESDPLLVQKISSPN